MRFSSKFARQNGINVGHLIAIVLLIGVVAVRPVPLPEDIPDVAHQGKFESRKRDQGNEAIAMLTFLAFCGESRYERQFCSALPTG